MNNNKVVVIDLLGSLFEYKSEFFKRLSIELYNRYNKRICEQTIEKWINNNHFIEGLDNLSLSIDEQISQKDFEEVLVATIFKDRSSIRECITKRRYIRGMLKKLREKNITIVTYSFLNDNVNNFILRHYKLYEYVDLHINLNSTETCITQEIAKRYTHQNISFVSSSDILDQYYQDKNCNSYCFDIKEIKDSALYIYSTFMFIPQQQCA
jgi:hypothetical protein